MKLLNPYLLLMVAGFVGGGLGSPLRAEGNHIGEVDKLSVNVEFLSPFGFTTTDETGIHYNYYGMTFTEPKIYPPSTYGQKYPLYFMGLPMSFRVVLSNTAEKGAKSFKIRVTGVNYVMEESGFSGMLIAPGSEWVVASLAPGETKVLNCTININNPNLPSGLDVTKVRIFHMNEGENSGAGFIKEYTAVWCPPKFRR